MVKPTLGDRGRLDANRALPAAVTDALVIIAGARPRKTRVWCKRPWT
jgi:hypothetical protein